MKDIRQKLLATFQIEHRDHVEQIRSLLATGGDPAGLEEAFRRAHSLKGAARAVDLRLVEGLAHRLETMFSRVRQGALALDPEVVGVAQQVLDASEDCVAAMGDNRETEGFRAALKAIERVLGMESEPAPPAPEPEKTDTAAPAFQPIETVRIDTRNFEGLLRSAGGLLAESLRQNEVSGQLNRIARRVAGLESEEARAVSRELDALCRLQRRSAWTASQLGKRLQKDIWQARMAPAESLIEGFRKMVRDLARDEGKEIEFRASSAGVQADRGVLDALKDPLMHLLRNAISHGIESPRERVARGKTPVGLVTLRLDTAGQRLVVTVSDDGRGVDLARVAEVAVRQGLLPAKEAASRPAWELARLVFQPGFSTSGSVSDLSGRGMGLSVVYEAVRRLQGEVDIEPGEGAGASIHLSVPLSAAAQRLLLVECAGQRFAVPIHGIERLRRIERNEIESLEGKPVVLLDGAPAPLTSLSQLLAIERPAPNETDTLAAIILRAGGRRAAVAVDRFLWESDAVIQDLGPAQGDRKVSGGILLDDGAVAFVLNPMELMESAARAEPSSLLEVAEPGVERPPASILIVDDSMTTRMLEKSILEAHGYRVRVAMDGIEALARLREERPDLVVSDLQMPRMDGFELLQSIKTDPAWEAIPVIIVSSLEMREDQERGLALGAAAYIVKRKFDQSELLAAIRQVAP